MIAKDKFRAFSQNSQKINSYVLSGMYYLLSTVLIVAGFLKTYDASGMIEVLNQISFLNGPAVTIMVSMRPMIELGLGMALAVKFQPEVILTVVAGLFLLFLGFSIYGYLSGLQGSCGCFGGLAESGFGWEMILRNLVLFCAAGFLWVQKSRL